MILIRISQVFDEALLAREDLVSGNLSSLFHLGTEGLFDHPASRPPSIGTSVPVI